MRNSPAELSPDQFREIGHDLVEQIADFLTSLPNRPVAPASSPSAMRQRLPASDSLAAAGEDPMAITREAARLLFNNSTFNGHPRFFGYITSSASPIGALADMLAASVNPNCGAWGLSPIATEIEKQSVKWIADLIGYPMSCGGLLVSGGNMANMVCLTAAIRAQAAWDVRKEGISHAKLTVYASAEVHTWLQKALDLCGLGTDAMRSVPVDKTLGMDIEKLRLIMAADRADGFTPAVVVGTAGSVSTGAIDSLGALAELCQREKLWFHVDGAYGAPAAVLPDASAALKALALADSVAVDPHKWLYAPIEAGCALVRDAGKLHKAYEFHPPYYRFEGADEDPPTNFHEWGPQNSRGFRALKVWMTMRQVGRDGYVRMIGDDCALAKELHALASASDELEALTYSLSIATFRYVPLKWRGALAEHGKKLDALNANILAKLQAEGVAYLSNAIVGGRFALRACVVNFRTDRADIRAVIDATLAAGRALSK